MQKSNEAASVFIHVIWNEGCRFFFSTPCEFKPQQCNVSHLTVFETRVRNIAPLDYNCDFGDYVIAKTIWTSGRNIQRTGWTNIHKKQRLGALEVQIEVKNRSNDLNKWQKHSKDRLNRHPWKTTAWCIGSSNDDQVQKWQKNRLNRPHDRFNRRSQRSHHCNCRLDCPRDLGVTGLTDALGFLAEK
jgi:hypothetical protein